MSAQTVSNAVARRQEDRTAIDFMMSKRPHLRTVLPKSIDVDAFVGTAAAALYASDVPGKNLTLMKCAIANVDSLYVALMECAALGHMPGTDEYYLTPRTDHGRLVVLGIEGYKGVIERMYRSGAVSNVVVREVCENDYFDYREGEMDKPVHRFGGGGTTGAAFFATAGKRGEMVGGYAYAHLLTGAVSRVAVLTRDDVFAARDSGGYKPSDSYNPWNRLDGGENHPEFKGRSMWWKTFAKRLEPWVPTSAEWRRESLRASAAAVEHARRPELPAAVNRETGEILDAELVEDPSPAAPESPRSEPAAPHAAAEAAGEAPPVHDHSAPSAETESARKAAHAQARRVLGEDRDARLLWAARIIDAGDGDVKSFDYLTLEELRLVAGTLAKVRDVAELETLLKSGEVPGGE